MIPETKHRGACPNFSADTLRHPFYIHSLTTTSSYLSFEDWKVKRFRESGGSDSQNNNNVPVQPDVSGVSPIACSRSPTVADILDTIAGTNPSVAAAADTARTPASPHFRVPLTDRFKLCVYGLLSARSHRARGRQSTSNTLHSKWDRYMLSPCSTAVAGQPQFVCSRVVRGYPDRHGAQLANFEFFSGVLKELRLACPRRTLTLPMRRVGPSSGRTSVRTCVEYR